MSETVPRDSSFEARFAAYQQVCAQAVANPHDFVGNGHRHKTDFIAVTHRNQAVLAEALRTGRHEEVFALYDDIADIQAPTRYAEGYTFSEYMHIQSLIGPIVDSLDALICHGSPAVSERARAILEEGAFAIGYHGLDEVAARHVVAATAEKLPLAYAAWRNDANQAQTRQLRILARAARLSLRHVESTPTEVLRDIVVPMIRGLGPNAPDPDHPLDPFVSGVHNSEFLAALCRPLERPVDDYAEAWREGYDVDLLPNRRRDPARISTDTYALRSFCRLFDLHDVDPLLPGKLLDTLNYRNVGRFSIAAIQNILAAAQNPGGERQKLLGIISRKCGNGAMLDHAETIERLMPQLSRDGLEFVVIEASSAGQVQQQLEAFDKQGHRFGGTYITAHGWNDSWNLSGQDECLTTKDCATWLGPLLGKISLPGSTILTGICWSAAGPDSPCKALHEHSGRRVVGTDGITAHRLEVTPQPGQPPLLHARFFERHKETPEKWKTEAVDPVVFDYATLQP